MLRAVRTTRTVLGKARAASRSITGKLCFVKRRIDGVFMPYVLSSPENADGFLVTGSMDWKGRTQECQFARAFQFAGPLPCLTKDRGF